MGNSNDSKVSEKKKEARAPYTFGKRTDLNPADFKFSKRENETILKSTGTIMGQQFIVEECKNCDIYLLDHIGSMTIDLCNNCRIICGPVESRRASFKILYNTLIQNKICSVFIRDCVDCLFMIPSQQ